MLDAGHCADQYERDRIDGGLPGQLEFLSGAQGDGVWIVGDVEIRNHAEDALLFLLLNLRFRLLFRRGCHVHFGDGGGERELDHRDDVHFTCVQDAGKCLRRETRRRNGELKRVGRNVGESELAVVVGHGFLLGRLAVKRESDVRANDGGSTFVRDLAADRARRSERIGAVSVLRLLIGLWLRLSERDRGSGQKREAEAEKRQRLELRELASTPT